MMKKIKIVVILLTMIIISGCIRDGLNECPEGNVKINLFVEKFRNMSQNPLDSYEDNFNNRVRHLRYFLYRNAVLIDQGMIDKFTKSSDPSYTFNLQNIEYGNYQIVIIANCTKEALCGNPATIDNLLLTYPGCECTEDFFTTTLSFVVESNDIVEYDVGLQRTQGVIRYTFKNLADDISDIEMIMKNVSSEKWITGDYKNLCEASRKYCVSILEQASDTEIGFWVETFPSLEGSHSAYYLSIYKNNEETPYITQLVTDTLTITRNQLLDIAVTFNNGELNFEIDLDSKWNGSLSGGETGLE